MSEVGCFIFTCDIRTPCGMSSMRKEGVGAEFEMLKFLLRDGLRSPSPSLPGFDD